jgi:hypothetical protein
MTALVSLFASLLSPKGCELWLFWLGEHAIEQSCREVEQVSGIVLSQRSVVRNIIAQYLETDSEVGYVVLDADLTGHDSHEILDDIRA